jgi:hypothetical protein
LKTVNAAPRAFLPLTATGYGAIDPMRDASILLGAENRQNQQNLGCADPASDTLKARHGWPSPHLMASLRPPRLLLRLWQGTDGIAHEPYVDSIGQLLECATIDRHNAITDPEKSPDLNMNCLHLAVGPSDDVNDLAQVLTIGTERRHALLTPAARPSIPETTVWHAGDSDPALSITHCPIGTSLHCVSISFQQASAMRSTRLSA